MELSSKNDTVITVSCSFCNNKFESREDLIDVSKKSMCYGCFEVSELSDDELDEVNVNVPKDKISTVTASSVAGELLSEVFPSLWSDRKSELKESSKKELAEEMFRAGVFLGVKAFMDRMSEVDDGEPDSEEKEGVSGSRVRNNPSR